MVKMKPCIASGSSHMETCVLLIASICPCWPPPHKWVLGQSFILLPVKLLIVGQDRHPVYEVQCYYSFHYFYIIWVFILTNYNLAYAFKIFSYLFYRWLSVPLYTGIFFVGNDYYFFKPNYNHTLKYAH